MANEFIGLQMVVNLRHPPERLCGTISGVEAGQSLTLTNVWSITTGQWHPRLSIMPSNIVDIVDATKDPAAQAFVAHSVPAPPPPPAPSQPAQPSFADPAILSFKPRTGSAAPTELPAPLAQPVTAEKENVARIPAPEIRLEHASRKATPTGSISESMRNLNMGAHLPDEGNSYAENGAKATASSQSQDAASKKKRRRQPRQPRNAPQDEQADATNVDSSKGVGRGKGWRQTPILQSTSSFQPFNSLKKKGGKGRQAVGQDNGWASEDVTDVQEMGDFDFEGGLAKFDKRSIFDQMRKDDQIDESERLVSHNRQPRPKPGTAGGKNLHYSENVLDLPSSSAAKGSRESPAVAQDFWNSEADDGVANGEHRNSGRELGSRQSSRRGESKMSTTRRSQSRKASATGPGQGPSRVNSGVSGHSHHSRRTANYMKAAGANEHGRKQFTAMASTYGFFLQPSSRRLETVSALQMLNLENIAQNELGLTEEMMTENSGRGIAEVTFTALADPAIKIRTGANDKSGPGASSAAPATVVILAGNNKSGIRAVAGGRHLRNKNVNVLLCVVGIERERDLLEDMRQQVQLYRNYGGKVFSKSELFEHVRKMSIPTLTIDTPRSAAAILPKPPAVTLIIDALLGLAITFDELRTAEQASVYELIEWANRNEAFVLAVDMPTGIDPSSGKASIVDGSPLYLSPRYVVAMGAPKRGLLEAIAAAAEQVSAGAGEAAPVVSDADPMTDWRLFVADIGFGAAVYKKAGTKIRRGIDFDDKWVLEMVYRGAADEEEYV
ncbi:uncharacterized protein E0L32_009364 [Thyridium curvatum]|uniref:Enhancer of mRNA-decapping protein 3 n=1 Tax=Thyridium curvatum TaxID=1093900 RepID=A0A507ARZ9_9PEZI|nr:uncharacterized protein E0L32_009364 [Thyridium curvatum]TPX09476.1 hypothetical protein E0L32_009364 [Thyridium curvatum]